MDFKITICVITYNSQSYLPELIKSIKASSLQDFELFFIDNNSQDGTVAFLEEAGFSDAITMLSMNFGHSYAANLALQKSKTRYLLLLDHDTVVDKDLFLKLYEAAESERRSEFSVFAPKIVDLGRKETYYGGNFHYIGKTYTNRKMPENLEIGMIGSTAPLIDLDKISGTTYFDNDFFIYWNDADFFYRLRAMGKRIKLVPDAVVYHLEGTQDYSHRGGVRYSSKRAYLLLRNHKLFILKNYSLSTILVFIPCFILYELFNITFCIKKMIFLKAYLRSIIGFLTLLKPMIAKRRIFQKMRRVDDKNLVGCYDLDFNPGVVSTYLEKVFVRILEIVFMKYYIFVKSTFWR